MVSQGVGVEPRWRRDGKELFYLRPVRSGDLMSVPVALGRTLEAWAPKLLFQTGTGPNCSVTQYDVGANGQKFLLREREAGRNAAAARDALHIVSNWQAALGR